LCHKCRATAALVDVGKFSAGVTASDHSIVKVMACQELQWQPGGQGTGRTPARGRIPRFRDRPPKYGQYTTPGGENYRELLLTLPSKRDILKWTEAEYQEVQRAIASRPRVRLFGRFGQIVKCLRIPLAVSSAPHPQPQGICGPRGLPTNLTLGSRCQSS